jgi:hypothetical protein
MNHEEETREIKPEDMIPLVREYLGLLEDKQGIDTELKRCFEEYKKVRNRILDRKNPLDRRIRAAEIDLIKMLLRLNLRGVKYQKHTISLDERPVFKQSIDKIIDALENNPLEHYENDKKTLARIINDAVKKKCRNNIDKNDPASLCIRVKNNP